MTTRIEQFKEKFPKEPKFRVKQIQEALFKFPDGSWEDATTLSKPVREELSKSIPWMSLSLESMQEDLDVKKALLKTQDGEMIETVLMRNPKDQWTVCLSSQIGCAMNCAFCATGKMGLKRNLTEDEIVDQVRFWQSQIQLEERISNLVFMGMGEPMANYENVKSALNTILDNTDLGPVKITVSTVGFLPRLNLLLDDPDWPEVRIAISLHSVDSIARKKLMPSSTPDFLNELRDWCLRYLEKFGNNRHHLTFEYLLIKGINDSTSDAKKLAKYVHSIGHAKVNIIAYNDTGVFEAPSESSVNRFCDILQKSEIDVLRRRSLGSGISAACGQLANQ